MIRKGSDIAQGFKARTEVCIIGSGAGGGLAAGFLAEAGKEVILLEEGEHVDASRMTQREDQMYPLLYRDGGSQVTDDGGITVMQGRTVGGSTVINMADCVDIPVPVLEHWATRFGVTRYSTEAVQAAARAARDAIGANPIAPEQLNLNNQLLLEGGRKLGIRGGVMDHNRIGCIGSGYCLIGCAYAAKRSVAVTWIPRALETGRCLVQTEARAERIEWSGTRARAVTGSIIDPRTNRALAPFRIDADRIILAAGAIHSPLLLLNSGLGGRQVGKNLSLQPQAPVAADFPPEVVCFRGIPQAASLNGFERQTAEGGLEGFRIESVSGGPAMSAVATGLSPQRIHAFMKRLRHTAACLVLVPDRPSGQVERGRDGRPRIRYTLTDAYIETLRRGIRTAAEVYLAAGAGQVVLPFAGTPPVASKAALEIIERLPVRAATVPLISAHPQGTCRMGRDPATSVVGLDLRVHGVDNLYVMDASIFPTSASSHTMIPVMTFALLAAGELA